VEFLYGRSIQRLDLARDGLGGVVVGDGVLKAEAYVVALGSYSPLLTRPVGVEIPVYPAKGYSATVDILDPARTPTVSLIDDSAKIVFTRLGKRLRIAGTAELSGYSTELNEIRCQALVKLAGEMFPGAADYAKAQFWAGLRPSTPSNVPIIGASKVPRLYLNTGHGTLGWTMACGSGRALADIISGRKPKVDFNFTTA
jgi:D-amino-acid dehydrogenase